jgi:uncharacterized protein YbaP (TraB family)
MNRPGSGLASGVLLALACASQGPTPSPDEPIPLAYEVEAPSGHWAFVLGSVHAERADSAGLHPVVLEAFRRSPLLVLEVDLSKVEKRELLDLMLELGRLPEGESLQDRISSDTWQLLTEQCQARSIRVDELQAFEPWLVALQFFGSALHTEGLEAEYGVERQLLASDQTKAIIGLESPRDQFALFDELPPHQQELMLRDALAPPAASSAELQELVSAWRRGDGPALEALLFGHLDESPELVPFYEATFFTRNLHMARGIETVLAEAPYAFVVLGAGHLVGARGVPALLESAGYRVHQVGAEPLAPAAPRLTRGARTASPARTRPMASAVSHPSDRGGRSALGVATRPLRTRGIP